jgi:MAE_28990/MAE_18760-like HEPN
MKVRSVEQLDDLLAEDLAWRKRELTTLEFAIRRARTHEMAPLTRSGIALLYAHWEGYIKGSATLYLAFVASKRLRLEELSSHILAVALRSKLRTLEGASKQPSTTSVRNPAVSRAC